MIVGVDDGPFARRRGSPCPIALVYHDGGLRPTRLDVVVAEVDGGGVAGVLADRVRGASLVVVDSVTICGFNYVDGLALHRETGATVVHVFLYPLDLGAIRRALEKAGLLDERFEVVKRAWLAAKRAECRLGGFWYTVWGGGFNPCRLQVYSRVPLPLQNAHRLGRLASSMLGIVYNRGAGRGGGGSS